MPDTPSADAPRRAPRYPRWTRARMVAFLRALRETGSVAAAARAVGMSRQSAYKLRDRLAGSAFDEAWSLAFELPPTSGDIWRAAPSPCRPVARPAASRWNRGRGKGDTSGHRV